MLWDRKWLILLSALAAGVAAFVIATVLPRKYTAEALMVVNTQEINIPDFQTIRSQGTVEPWGARSAALVLSSRELIERTLPAARASGEDKRQETKQPMAMRENM